METNSPGTYQRILEADRASRERFGGHGSALAQAYNHMILPLASSRDRRTQVLWGIRDFQQRFRRDPEGMWLPEAAVDTETLELLAEMGIRFTILAPHQAKQARRLHRGIWRSVEGGRVDPKQPYLCRLPSGRSINLFFYDGPISLAVAFEGLLNNGENFARRLAGGFEESSKWPQLMHISTDGETYGHHHRHGDMALAYALDYIESNELAKITNYGQFLQKHPPMAEVEIIDNSSWSCIHGVERWRSDCGCNTGMRAGWKQTWRTPLRTALDFLRDALAQPYYEKACTVLKDPWAARDEYIRVVLDRSPESLKAYFSRHAAHALNAEETTTALKLLEMQRHAMLMYTSCGWFFDELSGIETVQVIFYTGRVIQLAEELFGDPMELPFLELLAAAASNLPEMGNGADIYKRWVKPAVVNLVGVGAHYAISSLFDGHEQQNSIYCYDVDRHDFHVEQSGRSRLVAGCARIRSRITLEEVDISFGVLHLGDHNLNAGVRRFVGEQTYREMLYSVLNAFEQADLTETMRTIDRHFPDSGFSMKSLFRDEQRRVFDQIMNNVLGEAEASYRGIYDAHAPLMRFLTEVNMPLPRVLRLTAEFVINGALRRELSEAEMDQGRISGLLETARRDGITLESQGLSYLLRKRMNSDMQALVDTPRDLERLRRIEAAVRFARTLPFEVDLWKVQNLYWGLLQTVYPALRDSTAPEAREWTQRFAILGEALRVRMEHVPQELPVAV
jgi:hypothetical protein